VSRLRLRSRKRLGIEGKMAAGREGRRSLKVARGGKESGEGLGI
jgi:hypothetical protein